MKNSEKIKGQFSNGLQKKFFLLLEILCLIIKPHLLKELSRSCRTFFHFQLNQDLTFFTKFSFSSCLMVRFFECMNSQFSIVHLNIPNLNLRFSWILNIYFLEQMVLEMTLHFGYRLQIMYSKYNCKIHHPHRLFEFMTLIQIYF